MAVKRATDELVVLVDERDQEVGVGEKLRVHCEGRLHRAFSVFLFNAAGELLLQQRALGKYHSGGLWSNTCCSHPRPGELIAKAAASRLEEEMGISCPLWRAFDFVYQARVGEGLCEFEFDHVFVGHYDGEVFPNAAEVMAYTWMPVADLKADLRLSPESYTPWLAIALERAVEHARLSAAALSLADQ